MKFAAFSLIAASGALALTSSSTTTSTPTTISDGPTNIPSPGGPCVGSAYCLADTSPIILRCVNGIAQPGNCDDNLNEPQYGAVCVSYGVELASCSAVNPFANSTSTTTSTSHTTVPGTGITTTTTHAHGNGTLSYTPTAPPVTSVATGSATGSGSAPVSTGGASGRWTGGAMLGAAVAVLGGVVVL